VFTGEQVQLIPKLERLGINEFRVEPHGPVDTGFRDHAAELPDSNRIAPSEPASERVTTYRAAIASAVK
jgi:hypothetical protein